MILKTDQLLLKSPAEEFAEPLLDYFIRNREFFKPWTTEWADDFFTVEKQRQNLREKSQGFLSEKEIFFYIFPDTDDTRIIGDIGFTNIIKGPFLSCHLGYRIDKQEVRKGYMTEALRKAVQYMFEEVQLHRIEANIIPRNNPSIRLMEKLGFQNEGLSKNYLRIDGRWQDHLHYVLLNSALE